MKKGLFITFEGIDGSGKSTQARLLCDGLRERGMTVDLLRDPGGTAVGEHIREILLSTKHDVDCISELLLYEAARAQMVAEKIKPSLESGKTVVLDRFFDSTTAYQGYGRGIATDVIDAANKIAAQGLMPDMTILVDIDWETARLRRSVEAFDRLEKEDLQFFERVREGYKIVASQNSGRVRTVDGTLAVNDLQKRIWDICKELL